MKTIIRIVLSMLMLAFAYEGMVDAFHLLNEPSDRAVYTGMAMLGLLALFLPVVLWRLWRGSHVNFR